MICKGPAPNIVTAKEVAFLMEEEMITIQCTAKLGTLHLIINDFGPLVENRNCQVPIWVARQLRRAQLCRVVPPPWMSVESLADLLEGENVHPDDFQPLPFHYLEMATELLDWAVDDIPQSEQARLILQCLRERREMKIQMGLPNIDGNPLVLTNVSHLELNTFRPFLVGTLDLFTKIKASESQEIYLQNRRTIASSTLLDENSLPSSMPLDFSQFS